MPIKLPDVAMLVRDGGSNIGTRRAINFIESTNITIGIADDSTNEDVDVTISASTGGSGEPHNHEAYLVFNDAGTFKGRNGNTGNIDYSSSSAATTLNNCISAA